jgi:hypothetical protein
LAVAIAPSELVGGDGESAGGLIVITVLKGQLSLPVSTTSQWWVSRSSKAVLIMASSNMLGHSPKC